jgi:hypothetical protein
LRQNVIQLEDSDGLSALFFAHFFGIQTKYDILSALTSMIPYPWFTMYSATMVDSAARLNVPPPPV